MTKITPSHSDECVALVQWFGVVYPRYAPLLVHIPNEGRMSKWQGAKLNREGRRAGFPDYLLLIPRGSCPYLAIEMKRRKGDKPRKEQLEYAEIITSIGAAHKFCYGWEQAADAINGYLST